MKSRNRRYSDRQFSITSRENSGEVRCWGSRWFSGASRRVGTRLLVIVVALVAGDDWPPSARRKSRPKKIARFWFRPRSCAVCFPPRSQNARPGNHPDQIHEDERPSHRYPAPFSYRRRRPVSSGHDRLRQCNLQLRNCRQDVRSRSDGGHARVYPHQGTNRITSPGSSDVPDRSLLEERSLSPAGPRSGAAVRRSSYVANGNRRTERRRKPVEVYQIIPAITRTTPAEVPIRRPSMAAAA